MIIFAAVSVAGNEEEANIAGCRNLRRMLRHFTLFVRIRFQ